MDKILADRYRLTEQIGMGGMAIVYKAIDMRTGHNVAVKVLRPEFNEDAEFIGRFQREAEAASKMTHHNIVNLLDVGMDGENRYLVMEYVQGKTLKEVIQERGRLSAPLACQIAIRILSALEHAHRNGIIHRDIKPQNILVHADGHIKVADFGIARIADSSTLTKGDNVMGSVHYFSPEQARGEGANATSDIYSTGIVLYEMLTGRVPFDGDNPVAVAMQHLHATPIPILYLAPDVPPAVVRVCMKAMEKNPAMRYQSARDMAADLRVALDDRNERPAYRKNELEVRMPKPQIRNSKTDKRKRLSGSDWRKIRLWTLTALLTIGVFTGMFFGIQAIYQRILTSTVVPKVVGYTLEDADEVLSKEGLDSEVNFVSSDSYEKNTVIMQKPEADETTRKGNKVVLMVSKGPTELEIPNLENAKSSEAITALKNQGFENVTVERVPRGDYLEDSVVSMEPAAGTMLSRDMPIKLYVSGGETVIPDLEMRTLEEAEQELQGLNLTMNGTLQYVDTDDPEQHGLIASQDPEAGVHVVLNTAVTVMVYRCPAESEEVQIDVTMAESDQDIMVRVTLIAQNSSIELEGISYVCAANAYRKQTVNLRVPDSREYTFNVYADGELIQQGLLSAEMSADE